MPRAFLITNKRYKCGEPVPQQAAQSGNRAEQQDKDVCQDAQTEVSSASGATTPQALLRIEHQTHSPLNKEQAGRASPSPSAEVGSLPGELLPTPGDVAFTRPPFYMQGGDTVTLSPVKASSPAMSPSKPSSPAHATRSLIGSPASPAHAKSSIFTSATSPVHAARNLFGASPSSPLYANHSAFGSPSSPVHATYSNPAQPLSPSQSSQSLPGSPPSPLHRAHTLAETPPSPSHSAHSSSGMPPSPVRVPGHSLPVLSALNCHQPLSSMFGASGWPSFMFHAADLSDLQRSASSHDSADLRRALQVSPFWANTDIGVAGPNDEQHPCPDCGKAYSTSSNLARHRQTHRSVHDKKARKCPHCDKVYVSMPAYSMHVRTHSQGCQCAYCGKRFSRPWLLQGHIRTHTGEKPFSCPQCSKAFADKSNLRAHIQTHSSEKPYACGRCGKAFALKSYLYKHEESSCMRGQRLHRNFHRAH